MLVATLEHVGMEESTKKELEKIIGQMRCPKDFVCYFFGLTRMSLAFFLVGATLARLPGTLLLSLEGAQVYKGHYAITLGLAALYIGLASLLYRRREALYEWVSRWHPAED